MQVKACIAAACDDPHRYAAIVSMTAVETIHVVLSQHPLKLGRPRRTDGRDGCHPRSPEVVHNRPSKVDGIFQILIP